MDDYLSEIEYAVSNLISIIWQEHRYLEDLQQRIQGLTTNITDNHDRVHFLAENAQDLEDISDAISQSMDSYWGLQKDLAVVRKSLETLSTQIAAHAFSVGCLAGSLLQYAKQGISICHGKDFNKYPDGRFINSQSIKNIIWQGRNQSVHWEGGVLNHFVEDCFTDLLKNNPCFSDYKKQNKAFEIIELLGWTDFSIFKKDMQSLG